MFSNWMFWQLEFSRVSSELPSGSLENKLRSNFKYDSVNVGSSSENCSEIRKLPWKFMRVESWIIKGESQNNKTNKLADFSSTFFIQWKTFSIFGNKKFRSRSLYFNYQESFTRIAFPSLQLTVSCLSGFSSKNSDRRKREEKEKFQISKQ